MDDYQFDINLTKELRGLDSFNPDKIFRKSDGTWWIHTGVAYKHFDLESIKDLPDSCFGINNYGFTLGDNYNKNGLFADCDAAYSDSMYSTRFVIYQGDTTPAYGRPVDASKSKMQYLSIQNVQDDYSGTNPSRPTRFMDMYKIYFGIGSQPNSYEAVKLWIAEHPFDLCYTRPIMFSAQDDVEIQDNELLSVLNDMFNQITPNSLIYAEANGVNPKIAVAYKCSEPTIGYQYYNGEWIVIENVKPLNVRIDNTTIGTPSTWTTTTTARLSARWREILDRLECGGKAYLEINTISSRSSCGCQVETYEITNRTTLPLFNNYKNPEDGALHLGFHAQAASDGVLFLSLVSTTKVYESVYTDDDYVAMLRCFYFSNKSCIKSYAPSTYDTIRVLTKSQYDALSTKYSDTIYMIKAS